MTPARALKREAFIAAASIHQRPDGSFQRRTLETIAEAQNVPLSTGRRWLSEAGLEPLVEPTLIDAEIRASLAAVIEAEGLGHEDTLLVMLASTGGNVKEAFRIAQHITRYPKVYRSFVRDIKKLDPVLVAAAANGHEAMAKQWIYMSRNIPHRNHTWFLDHTQANIFVLPDRGKDQFRPWVTVIVDGATDLWLAVLPWDSHVNAERIGIALARAAAGDGRYGDDLSVGGLPTVLVFDNAREHLSAAVTEGCARFGINVSPTTPYRSWQNGRVETAHNHLARGLLAKLSAYTHAGVDANKDPLLTSNSPVGKDGKPTRLTMSGFAAALEEFRIERNNTVRDRHGRTPQERWDEDQTPLRYINPAVVLANMSKSDREHTVNKGGIRFRNRDYVAQCLVSYRAKRVMVRHMPTVTDWIEVFTLDGTHIGRAFNSETLPAEERNRIMAGRARQEQAVRRMDGVNKQHRIHLAHVLGDGWDPDDLTLALPSSVALDPDQDIAPELPPVSGRRSRSGRHDQAWDALVTRMGSDFPLESEGPDHG